MVPRYRTNLRKCPCGGKLTKKDVVDAKCFSLEGVSTVKWRQFQCSNRGCRKSYGPNYVWKGQKKYNTATVRDIQKQGILFTNGKTAFSKGYLDLFSKLNFRGYLTATAAVWSMQKAFPSEKYLFDQRKEHQHAILYYTAVQELTDLGLHKDIQIGKEVTNAMVDKYDAHLHKHVYPPENPSRVEFLVGDGHMKVKARCGSMGTCKKTGRPKIKKGKKNTKNKKNKHGTNPFTNGWFMICDPKSQRIVAVEQQILPERNTTITAALTKAVKTCNKAHTFVYDRNCGYHNTAQTEPGLKNIKNYVVEPWHGNRHKRSCKLCVQNNRRLKKLMKGVNGSICEQTFSWFRNFARPLNETTLQRHRFLVLHYCKLHNENVDKQEVDYLNEASLNAKKRILKNKRSYPCARGKRASSKTAMKCR